MSEIVLAILIFAPLALTFLLRCDAALGFLALCTGFTAATYASGNTQSWLDNLSSSGQLLSSNAISVIMIAAPLLITLLLTVKRVPKSRFLLQVIPALAAGGLLAIAIAPLLSEWINVNFDSVSFWRQLQKSEAVIIGLGALSSLLVIWSTGLKAPKGKKHK